MATGRPQSRHNMPLTGYGVLLALAVCGVTARRIGVDDMTLDASLGEPWQGSISEISSDKLREVMQSDMHFMLKIQKDIVQLLNMERRLPNVFKKKFRNIDDAKEEFFKAVFSVTLSQLGKAADAELVKQTIKLYKDYKEAKKIMKMGKELTLLQTARLKLIVDEGRGVPTQYAHDVPLGGLYQSYVKVRRAVHMKFYSKSQDWRKFIGNMGNKAAPIYADLEHLNKRKGLLMRGEEYIIDEIQDHLLPEGIHGDEVKFDAANAFEHLDEKLADPKLYTSQVTNASVGKFGHLGDGRGWVRLDLPSRYGGVWDSKLFTDAERRERCELMQGKLNQVTLPDDATIEGLRAAASKARSATHNVVFDIGEMLFGVALLGTAVVFPPAAPACAVIGSAAGLASKTVSVGSQTAFQAFLEPLLMYTLVSLANLEFHMFNPDMKPLSGSKMCEFDASFLSQFKEDYAVPEKVSCDIVSEKCGAGMFCFREGIFTRTTGRYSRTGFCMDAPWPLAAANETCTGDVECASGVCDLNSAVEDAAFGDGNSEILKFLGASSLDEVAKDVKSLLGLCVEPCDLKEDGCDRHDMQASFGVRHW